MEVKCHLPLVDEILGEFKDIIGRDFDAYKNHVCRVTNLCYATGTYGTEEMEKVQIAACFHDIGIWTDKTLDYLPPSINKAEEYLRKRGREYWFTEISEMIEMHHRVSSCADSEYPLVEAFRRADVADFSLGFIPMGFPRNLIAELQKAFPNNDFHMRLLQLGVVWFIKNPLNPLPMFRA